MKINKSNLLSPLQSLCKIALGRNSLPVLNSILVEATNNTLKLLASNIDEHQTEVVPCEGDLSAICIPARILLELVSAAPDWIDMQVDGGTVKITGAGEAKIAYLPAIEFVPEPTDKFVGVGLNLSDLVDGIEAVKWAQYTGTNPDRGVLCSVHVVGSKHEIMCEAFTGVSLGRFVRPSIAADCDFLIHSPFVAKMVESLNKDESILSLGEKYLRVTHKTGDYACKLMEGNYPNLNNGTQASRRTLGDLAPTQALSPLKICQALVPKEQTGRVKVEFQPKWMRIILNGQNQHHYSDTILGKFEQVDMCLGLDTLVDCLSAFKEDSIRIETHAKDDLGEPIILSGKELTTFSSQMRPT